MSTEWVELGSGSWNVLCTENGLTECWLGDVSSSSTDISDVCRESSSLSTAICLAASRGYWALEIECTEASALELHEVPMCTWMYSKWSRG